MQAKLNIINYYYKLYRKCNRSDTIAWLSLIRYLRYRYSGRRILVHQGVTIRGLENINTCGLLQIGVSYVGFMHRADRTYINANGSLSFRGNYDIGRGCRFDIGKDAQCSIGTGYINANSLVVISHGLEVGDNCAIGWDCRFLDDDFHSISYAGRTVKDHRIVLGNHIWVGSNVTILKGVRIPDNCVVAANSVVTRSFADKGVLIGGNPARVIKQNVSWE